MGHERIGISLFICTKPGSPTNDYARVTTREVVNYLRTRVVQLEVLDVFTAALVRSYFPTDGWYNKKPVKLVIKFVVATAWSMSSDDPAVLFHDLEHETMQWGRLRDEHTRVRVYAEVEDGLPAGIVSADKSSAETSKTAVHLQADATLTKEQELTVVGDADISVVNGWPRPGVLNDGSRHINLFANPFPTKRRIVTVTMSQNSSGSTSACPPSDKTIGKPRRSRQTL